MPLGALSSGYLYLGVAGLANLLLVPLYLRLLGPLAWGDVALCLTVQGVLFGIDAVLGPLLIREVARAAAGGDPQRVHRRFLRLYGGIALACFALGQLALASPLMAGAREELIWSGRLALLQFLFQFANFAVLGTWHGLQRQVQANLRQVGFLLLKHAAALGVLTLSDADAARYFLPFALISALEFGLNAARIERDLRVARAGDPTADARRTPEALFLLAAGLGLLSAQVDRIVLSVHLPAETFGRYFLLGIVLLSLLHLQMPVQRALLPRIVAGPDAAAALRSLQLWMAGFLALPCLLAALAPGPLLALWLQDAAVVAAGSDPLRLMLIAAACLALAAPAQAALLRAGRFGVMASLNGLVLLLQLGLLLGLLPQLGMLAGGLSWLAAGAILLIGSTLAARRLPD